MPTQKYGVTHCCWIVFDPSINSNYIFHDSLLKSITYATCSFQIVHFLLLDMPRLLRTFYSNHYFNSTVLMVTWLVVSLQNNIFAECVVTVALFVRVALYIYTFLSFPFFLLPKPYSACFFHIRFL